MNKQMIHFLARLRNSSLVYCDEHSTRSGSLLTILDILVVSKLCVVTTVSSKILLAKMGLRKNRNIRLSRFRRCIKVP